jgi:anaerobic ribonucleoside-triphosphate reductase
MKRSSYLLELQHMLDIFPEYAIIKIKEFYNDLKIKRTFNSYILNQICNLDETPIFLNMVPNKTINFKGKKTVTIKITNQEKLRVSLLSTITANRGKLHPYLNLSKGER